MRAQCSCTIPWRVSPAQSLWVGQPQSGDEQVSGGDEGGVVVPAELGAALEMI